MNAPENPEIPHICQFLGTTALFRPVKVAPKNAYMCHKIAKIYARWGIGLKKVTNMSYPPDPMGEKRRILPLQFLPVQFF